MNAGTTGLPRLPVDCRHGSTRRGGHDLARNALAVGTMRAVDTLRAVGTMTSDMPIGHASYDGARFVELELVGPLEGARFADCTFERCNLRGAALIGCTLIDSDLLDCDLSHIDVYDSAFLGVVLERCQAIGIDWSRARTDQRQPFDLGARDSTLDFCSFDDMVLRERRFESCSLIEASFERSDLREASFKRSDLSGARFRHCDLRGADLRHARRYSLDVRLNEVAGMKVTLPDALVLLEGLEVRVEE
jgi:fluoroquinolone resistance protein